MKLIKNISVKIIAIVAIFTLFSNTAWAQDYNKKYYANADWQFNVPLGNQFANKASGWGMNLDGGYYITPNIGVGLFVAFSNNNQYIPTETFPVGETGTITTNQQRSLFQLPFGATFRYKINTKCMFNPYVALKMGPSYSKLSSYISTYVVSRENWGFYVSPEIGTNMWFTPNKTVGLNMSLYYSFSTNKGRVLNGDIDNLSNFGFRVGLGF